jgi:hypothetical protein
MKTISALAAAAALALPAPTFTTAGHLQTLSASGPTAALATNCTVRLLSMTVGTRPSTVAGRLPCGLTDIVQIGLGGKAVFALVRESPSPHGDRWTLWRASRPIGSWRQVGGAWGWNDSAVPPGFGCLQAVAAGGGVVATAQEANPLAITQGIATGPSCPAGLTTTITLDGTTRPRKLVVRGPWTPLATDGKRLVLARLDPLGQRTGEAQLVDLTGGRLRFTQPARAIVRAATGAWLVPEGLVLRTPTRLVAPRWSVGTTRAATVGQGRVVYAVGSQLLVRRLRGGLPRLLLRLPAGEVSVAAGSNGVALAIDRGNRVSLYRLPWLTIDKTLTR